MLSDFIRGRFVYVSMKVVLIIERNIGVHDARHPQHEENLFTNKYRSGFCSSGSLRNNNLARNQIVVSERIRLDQECCGTFSLSKHYSLE